MKTWNTITNICSLFLLIFGLITMCFPSIFDGMVNRYISTFFLLSSVFVRDNVRIKELEEKVEKLEKENLDN